MLLPTFVFNYTFLILSVLSLVLFTANGDPQALKRRNFIGSIFQNSGSTSPSSSQSALQKPETNDTCKPLPFTQETWQQLKLDDYLKNYPGGHNTTIAAFAESKGVLNFDCGINLRCYAGQPCYPTPLKDWYILFAIQQWNAQRNLMVKAISFAINFVEATITNLLSSMFPSIDTLTIDLFKVDFGVNSAVTMVSNTLFLDILAMFHSFQLGWNLFFNEINNIIVIAMYGVAGFIPIPKGPENDAYTLWSHFTVAFDNYRNALTDAFVKSTDDIIHAGISSPDGIWKQLQNGTFIVPTQPVYLPAAEEDLKNVTTALAVVQVLRALDSFVTIGTDPCNGKGKNGALEGQDVLSYCDQTGTMFNIFRVGKEKKGHHEDKLETKFQRATVIADFFGLSTEFLTQSSLKCQKKFGKFNYFPYTNTTVPRDPSADCVINLPVCDCREPKIKKSADEHGVLSACREAGLPI
ncbi:hypothetical protein PPACK8108_LOCUS25952 [Phakopsora pachyrhizi]|uniref:DUF7872 domain-containing protein n=1 Tax=Phakopsora pachyrhizi TaxID=170000 RepID=A0AAV0BW40_PHAPC|nr:hypothetical protein PPACK8108_LOCUS25952 [Phakopsora pachyrhizi]